MGIYTPKQSDQVNFLWGRNDARTAIEHGYWRFIHPQKIYTPQNKFLATPLLSLPSPLRWFYNFTFSFHFVCIWSTDSLCLLHVFLIFVNHLWINFVPPAPNSDNDATVYGHCHHQCITSLFQTTWLNAVSNKPLKANVYIGKLGLDGWAVLFGTKNMDNMSGSYITVQIQQRTQPEPVYKLHDYVL